MFADEAFLPSNERFMMLAIRLIYQALNGWDVPQLFLPFYYEDCMLVISDQDLPPFMHLLSLKLASGLLKDEMEI